MSEIRDKIESLCGQKEYSTHHISDKEQLERIKNEGKEFIIIDDIILEWLDKDFPIPTKESIIEAKISSE